MSVEAFQRTMGLVRLTVCGGQPMMRLLRRALLLVAFHVITSAATAYAGSAWVLWEHVTGFIDGRAQDFWLLRAAGETRNECRQLANEQISFEMGEGSGSLLGAMIKAERQVVRPGWARIRTGMGDEDRAPDGQRGFMRHDLVCWPTGTDPRPRSKE
jgi:hypothetical protein